MNLKRPQLFCSTKFSENYHKKKETLNRLGKSKIVRKIKFTNGHHKKQNNPYKLT